MSIKTIEQFDVLSNALRIFPERVLQLRYYALEVNDPEEGISNIESAFREVLNQFYGMVGALKDQGVIKTLYCHESFNTLLCLRHSIQHGSGRIKNLLRETIIDKKSLKFSEIIYNASNTEMTRVLFLINATWFESGIKSGNYPNKWEGISTYWNLENIKKEIIKNNESWETAYIDITSLIIEAMRVLVSTYGQHFSASGDDSKVYYRHFQEVAPIDSLDYHIIYGLTNGSATSFFRV